MQTISAEEFKKRYGTTGVAQFQVDKKPSYLDRLKSQFSSGVNQVKEGLTAPAPNPVRGLENTLKTAAGVVNTAFSPITAAVQPAIEPTIGRAVNYAADKISDNPTVQKFATSKAGEITSRVTEDINNLNTVVGAIAGPKGVKAGAGVVTRGVEDVATNVATKAGQVVEKVGQSPIIKGARNVAGIAAEEAKRIPERIATNVAQKQATQLKINSLPTQVARKAAQDGLDVADVENLYKIPQSQKAPLKQLAQITKDFAEGKTKTNPIEVVGKPIVNRLKELEKARTQVGAKLGEAADNLGVVTSNETFPAVFGRLKKVNGLDGLTVDDKGVLNFKNTVLATAETAGDRKAIQSIFTNAVKWGQGKNKHLLRQELFESLGGKKRASLNLTATQEKAYEAIRQGLSDVLESKNPAYKTLSGEYRKIVQPLQEMRGYMKKVVGADEDILDMSAGLLARRLTSAAKSNPEIKAVLNAMDKATAVNGKTRLSVETLQDFYNILEKYYDIAPKTGFQAQVRQGVEKATSGPLNYITEQIKGYAGETPAVRQKALENILKEILGN